MSAAPAMTLDDCVAALRRPAPGLPVLPASHPCGAPLAASQAQYFCGYHGDCRPGSPEMVRRAVQNLRERYLFVGLLEEHDLSIRFA